MKKDISFEPVKNIYLAVIYDEKQWRVFLINRGKDELNNVLITSKGYGEKDGIAQKTSTLRHHIPKLEAGEYALIEPISEDVLHLNNEYWLSYYVGAQIFDRKYIFVPGSIDRENLIQIPELGLKGILHT